MFLIDVYMGTEFNLTVLIVVKFKACQDGPGTHGVMYPIIVQETV